MSDSYSSNKELRRLQIARDLFTQLLSENYDYPPDVEIDLEKDLSRCEVEIVKFDSKTIKSHAKVWTNETGVNGKIIDEISFNELEKQKNFYEIFILDNDEYNRNSVGKVYIKGKAVFKIPTELKTKGKSEHFTPLLYRILFYTLKMKGSPGLVFDLLEHCWFEKKLADYLRDKHYLPNNQIVDQSSLNVSVNKVRTAISRLSNKFLCDIGTELSTSKTGYYNLNHMPNYCLIKML